MTREEARRFVTQYPTLAHLSEQLGLLFLWNYAVDEDRKAARTLGVRVCVVPVEIWRINFPGVEACMAALLRGDVRIEE